MKCLACGDHPLNYIHCDRWDCPLLVVRSAIEAAVAAERARCLAIVRKHWVREPAATEIEGGVEGARMPPDDEEEERDPAPPDEDDDEVAVDWDENGYWPSENDEAEEEEE